MQKSLYDIRMEFWHNSYEKWRTIELFSFQWFVVIGVIIILYILLIKYLDKARLKDLLLFGSFISVSAAFIDLVGATIGLWEYKIRLFPFSPAVFPFDYTMIPILYMFVLQYTSSWRNYLIGSVLASAFNCFIINPLYVSLGILEYHKFNYFYLFILIVVVTTIVKAIYDWLDNIQQKKSMDRTKKEIKER